MTITRRLVHAAAIVLPWFVWIPICLFVAVANIGRKGPR